MKEIESCKRNLQSQRIFWISDIDKKFYFDRYDHYILNPNDPDGYWYNMTLYETEVYNYNINYDSNLDAMDFWINVPVFSADRQPIGILITSINLSYYINNIYNNYTGDGEIFFINSNGEITGARNSKLIKNKINIMRVLLNTIENILSVAN